MTSNTWLVVGIGLVLLAIVIGRKRTGPTLAATAAPAASPGDLMGSPFGPSLCERTDGMIGCKQESCPPGTYASVGKGVHVCRPLEPGFIG